MECEQHLKWKNKNIPVKVNLSAPQVFFSSLFVTVNTIWNDDSLVSYHTKCDGAIKLVSFFLFYSVCDFQYSIVMVAFNLKELPNLCLIVKFFFGNFYLVFVFFSQFIDEYLPFYDFDSSINIKYVIYSKLYTDQCVFLYS